MASDAPLIRRGTERAVVRAAVVSEDRELLLEVEITAGRANRARINRAPLTRARDILGVLRTVLFAPEDLALVRGDPTERRKFLDEVLIMRAPRLAGMRADYDRVLKQRNALLKTAGAARRSGGDLGTLDVWDEHLAAAGTALVHARLALVAELRPHVAAAYADVAGSDEIVDLVYRSTIPLETGTTTRSRRRQTLHAAMLAELLRVRSNELDRGISLVGPHRDDLELLLGGGPAKGYASHGESWSFALALRLGCVRVAAVRRGGSGAGAGRRVRRAGRHPPRPVGRVDRRCRPGADHRRSTGRCPRRRSVGSGCWSARTASPAAAISG